VSAVEREGYAEDVRVQLQVVVRLTEDAVVPADAYGYVCIHVSVSRAERIDCRYIA
jgi:hypothetical protein